MGKVNESKVVARMKAGEVIIVRSKNGDALPSFRSKPSAYRCKLGDQNIPGALVWKLIQRRTIACVNRGWFSEGRFQFNRDLRDKHGRFKPQRVSPHGR